MQDIEDDGMVVCLSDPTPVYPEGEEWEVETQNLRAGHPEEASGFGMLDLDNALQLVHKTAWGSVASTISRAVLSCAVLCHAVLCCAAVRCCAVLCRAGLCCALSCACQGFG